MRAIIVIPCAVMVFLWSICVPVVALADTTQEILRQQNQIIQQEEQRRRLLEEEMRERRERPPQAVPVPEEKKEAAPEASAICFSVKTIDIQGVTLLSAEAVDALRSPYVGRCLTLDDMNALVQDITNAYVETGYVAARAFLPEQDLSAGTLTIVVLEGFVEGIILNDGSGRQQNQLRTAFPGLRGKPLNLRDLEQGLDQMNRLPSNDARMRLEPGQKQGGSIVHIDNSPAKSWRASAGLANNGQRSTGRHLYSLSFEKDNLIGLNDQFSLHRSADARAIGGDRPRNESMSGYMSIPYGYWTLYASMSLFEYTSTLEGLISDYTSSGETTTVSAGLDRVVHRDSTSKTIAGISFTKREISNYINNTKLILSSYDLATSTLRLQHSRRLGSAVLSLGGEYHHGFSALGAEQNPYDLNGVPDTEYDKYVATASASIPLPPFAENLALQSSVFAQFSPNTLYGAEQVSVGGLYSVRGFQDESVSADKGGYMRNELVWTQAAPDFLRLNTIISSIQPYVFYDAGYVHPLTDREDDRGLLQGSGCGIRLQGDNVSLEIMAGKPLDHPESIEKDPWTTYTSVRFTF